jgi:hypothetical protein
MVQAFSLFIFIVLALSIATAGEIQKTVDEEGVIKYEIKGTPASKEEYKDDINFSLGKITVTNKLEVRRFTNEIKTVNSVAGTKFIIVPITIENKQNKWLSVQTGFLGGLIDDEYNRYMEDLFIETKEGTYAVVEISFISKEETTHIIQPNSTEMKKFVFTIPQDRQPKKLSLSYGFSASKQAVIKDWFHAEIKISQ